MATLQGWGKRGEVVVHDNRERVVGCKSKERSGVYFGVLATLKKQLVYNEP